MTATGATCCCEVLECSTMCNLKHAYALSYEQTASCGVGCAATRLIVITGTLVWAPANGQCMTFANNPATTCCWHGICQRSFSGCPPVGSCPPDFEDEIDVWLVGRANPSLFINTPTNRFNHVSFLSCDPIGQYCPAGGTCGNYDISIA